MQLRIGKPFQWMSKGIRAPFWLPLVIALLPCQGLATVWNVVHDPARPDSLIGQAVRSASSGDTILISPGTYFEHIPIREKTLTLIGSGGPDVTILDGSRDFPGLGGSILYSVDEGPQTDLTLIGLTLQNGFGVISPWLNGLIGGAVSWTFHGRLRLEHCTLRENKLLDGPTHMGGAIGLVLSEGLAVERCAFSGNQATYDGGSIQFVYGDSLIIQGCDFLLDEPIGSTSLFVRAAGNPISLIEECSFTVSGQSESPAFGLDLDSDTVVLTGNRFVDRTAQLATRVRIYDQFKSVREISILLEQNVFWCDPTQAFPLLSNALHVAVSDAQITLASNTFVRAPVDLEPGGTSQVEVLRNIAYRGPIRIGGSASGTASCNVSWPDSVLISSSGGVDLLDNVRAAPMFCDADRGDLRIAEESPAAPEHAPEGCGLIGAEQIGCTQTPIQEGRWGATKRWFQKR